MKALKCDDCGKLYEEAYRGDFYSAKDGVSSSVGLDIQLDLCSKCWNKMLRVISFATEEKDEIL